MKILIRWLLVVLLIIPLYGIYRNIYAPTKSDLGFTVGFLPSDPPVFYISEVEEGGYAKKAGLAFGDKLLAMEGKTVETCSDLWETQSFGDTLELTVQRNGERLDFSIPIEFPSLTDILLNSAYLLLAIIFLIFGLIVYSQAEKSPTHTLFLLLCISSATALLPLPMELYAPTALTITDMLYLPLPLFASLLSAMFIFLLALHFPRRHKWISKTTWLVPVVVLFCLASALISATFGYAGLLHKSPLASFSQPVYYFHISLCILLALGALAVFVHRLVIDKDPALRRRLHYLIFGTILGASPLVSLVILNFMKDFLYLEELFLFKELLVYPLILIPLTYAYSLISKRAREIGVVISKILVYSFVIAVLIALVAMIELALEYYTPQWVGFNHNLPLILMSAIIIIPGFPFLRWVFIGFADRFIFREKFRLEKDLQELLAELPTFKNPKRLADILSARLERIFNSTSCSIYFQQGEKYIVAGRGKKHPLHYEGGLTTTFKQSGHALYLPEAETIDQLSDEEKESLMRIDGELTVPLRVGNNIIGLIVLSEKESEGIYTTQEQEVLFVFAGQVAPLLALIIHD